MENDFTNSQFEEFEKYDSLTDKDIFTKIWTQPRKIFKFINDTKYEKYFYILMFFAGVVRAFDQASTKNMGDKTSLPYIILTCFFVGGALGWISFFIYAALLSWTGKWLNGAGNTSSIYRMMAYAMIPSIFALAFLIPQMAVFGVDVFRDADYDSGSIFGTVVFWVSLCIEMILSVTTLVFMVIGLSEVQKFSVWKAILNLFLPIFIILFPILLLVALFAVS
ncbi:Yip1 family protein [Chryseobacterium foetidum]|uniref:Yip1 family protein n=1 Tax=Chryseobacterium foetidum TaxID=2951057 RepID=UPI0021C9B5E8|nr:Yip1 family protein [Chryseobacterium foetidum]